jgi:hypothetical protein
MNLFYACNRCNSWKGAYWPSPVQRAAGQFIPNPCEHVMFDHVKHGRGSVEPKSAAGKFMIEHLDLNDPEAVEMRTFLVNSAQIAEARVNSLTAAISEAAKLSASASTPQRKVEIDACIVDLRAALAQARQVMDTILG